MGLPSAVLEAGAQIIGAGISAFSQHSANEANKKLAQDQMDFQERMSDTAYQRQMADMRKAGLNPILAGHMGGASSPGGGYTPMQSVLPGAGQLANSAVATALTRKTAKEQLSQQSDLVKAQTQLATSQAHLADANSANTVTNIVSKGAGLLAPLVGFGLGSRAVSKLAAPLLSGLARLRKPSTKLKNSYKYKQ